LVQAPFYEGAGAQWRREGDTIFIALRFLVDPSKLLTMSRSYRCSIRRSSDPVGYMTFNIS
jgi:hypothetical protein